MGCGASEAGNEDVLVVECEDEESYERWGVNLRINPLDDRLGEDFHIKTHSQATVVMVMALVQDHMARSVESQQLMPVLWEPKLSYEGNNLTGVKLGLTLQELGIQYSAQMRVEIVPLSGSIKQRRSEDVAELRQNNTVPSGGALWNAPKWERPDYGLSQKRKTQRDPRSVLSEIDFDAVVAECKPELKRKLRKYMVVESVNKASVKGKDFTQVMAMIERAERPLTVSFKSPSGRSIPHTFSEDGSLGIRLVDRLKLLNDEYHDLSIELMASPRNSPERQRIRKQVDDMDRWIEQTSNQRSQRQQTSPKKSALPNLDPH